MVDSSLFVLTYVQLRSKKLSSSFNCMSSSAHSSHILLKSCYSFVYYKLKTVEVVLNYLTLHNIERKKETFITISLQHYTVLKYLESNLLFNSPSARLCYLLSSYEDFMSIFIRSRMTPDSFRYLGVLKRR